jgi:hypothetical protein
MEKLTDYYGTVSCIAPYTYAWSNGVSSNVNTISDLNPGSYNVLVTDALTIN